MQLMLCRVRPVIVAGTAAIQVAKQIGTKIFTTAGSQDKLDFAKELGADVLINYRDQDFAEVIKKETQGPELKVRLLFHLLYFSCLLRHKTALHGHLDLHGCCQLMAGELRKQDVDVAVCMLLKTQHLKLLCKWTYGCQVQIFANLSSYWLHL